jgi:hypothetical protein
MVHISAPDARGRMRGVDNENRAMVIMWTSMRTVCQLYTCQYDSALSMHKGQSFLIELTCNNV